MGTLGIYRDYPLLESQWEGFAHPNNKLLLDSQNWYVKNLIHTKGPVCELACGYGRLLYPLAKAGIQVTGCDAVEERIQAAEEFFRKNKLQNYSFEVCEMPEVPKDKKFNAVILACNAIGYLLKTSQKLHLLKNIREILHPNGYLLLDHSRGSIFLKLLGKWPGLKGGIKLDGNKIYSELSWDAHKECIVEGFCVYGNLEYPIVYKDYFRFTDAQQTIAMIRDAGFEIERVYNGFTHTPYRAWSRRISIIAKRL
jgi:2-polyprenyl-3-methyl-5-hydroxy-6-metoxy-1,4-benzoquinol methylase